MANFSLPDWYVPPVDPPPPPRHPEFDIADAAREQQLNDQYLAGRREILNTGDGAYFRTQGEAAIHAGPPALEALHKLREDTLAQAGNDHQRANLAQRLDFHHGEATQGVSRHLSGQWDAWLEAIADGQVTAARDEAAANHNDPAKVEFFATGIYHTRLASQPGDPPAAQARAETARSGVYRSAIEGALAAGDNRSAITLYDRAKERLAPADALPLQGQIKTVTESEIANDYVGKITTSDVDPLTRKVNESAPPLDAPQGPPGFFDASRMMADADAAHQAATTQNQTDWSHDPTQLATNQHVMDVQFIRQKREVEQAKVRLDHAVVGWLMRPMSDGSLQVYRPQPAVWAQLSYAQQRAVDFMLLQNASQPLGMNVPVTAGAIGQGSQTKGTADVQLVADPPDAANENVRNYVCTEAAYACLSNAPANTPPKWRESCMSAESLCNRAVNLSRFGPFPTTVIINFPDRSRVTVPRGSRGGAQFTPGPGISP